MLKHIDSTRGERTTHAPPRTAAQLADRARRRAVDSGRWFSGYLVLLGLVSAVWITLLEAVFSDGLQRLFIGAVWAIIWLGASWWAERHTVFPAGANRVLWLAFGTWFGLYLVVIGPIVRGQYGDALVPWAIGSLLMSAPFLVAALWLQARR